MELVTHKRLQVLDTEPTGLGGRAINDNFKAIDERLTHLAATDPTWTDDRDQKFAVASRWFNTATSTEWVCVDDAPGAAQWQPVSGGTGGADTQIQFNDGGAHGGASALTWNKTTNVLDLAGIGSISMNGDQAAGGQNIIMDGGRIQNAGQIGVAAGTVVLDVNGITLAGGNIDAGGGHIIAVTSLTMNGSGPLDLDTGNIRNAGNISGFGTLTMGGGIVANKDDIASTPTDALILANNAAATTTATAQMSPRIRLRGHAWKSAATAANQTADWTIENLPATGLHTATSSLRFGTSTNGAAYIYPLTIHSNGAVQARGTVSGQPIFEIRDLNGNLKSYFSAQGDLTNFSRMYNAQSDVYQGFSVGSSNGYYFSSSGSTGTRDTGITRTATNALAIGNASHGNATGTLALGTLVLGGDTNLYRGSANVLTTDDSFNAAGYQVGGAAGLSQTIQIFDSDLSGYHKLTFTGGILTAYSTFFP